MVSIDGRRLEIVTELGKFDFAFPTTEGLSEALLILALQGTKTVEHRDEQRFNPARVFPFDSAVTPAGHRPA